MSGHNQPIDKTLQAGQRKQQRVWRRWAGYGLLVLYALYLHLFYHVLLVPAFAEYSFYGFLAVPFVLFAFWLLPAGERKRAAALSVLYVFLQESLSNIEEFKGAALAASFVVIALVLYALAWLYARVKWTHAAVIASVALILHLAIPQRMELMLTEFYPKWISEPQYLGEIYGHLPFNVADVDGDGREEIITLGNRDFYPEGRMLPQTYRLYEEPLRVMAWELDETGRRMRRVPDEAIDVARLERFLPEEYVGFPYYRLNADLELVPLVQRKDFTEGMIQFGTAPFRALRLNLENIMGRLAQTGGVHDRLEQDGGFADVVLAGGRLSGTYRGQPFDMPHAATELIGAVRLADGSEGLLVRGRDVELLQWREQSDAGGSLIVTHRLTREMQRDLSYSIIRIHDVNGDGADEVVITYPYATILSAGPDGSWSILWGATQSSLLHIKDIGPLTPGAKNELIAFNKSKVRASGIHYLASFSYTDKGLKQNWKVFTRNLDLVMLADLKGTGKNDLVVTFADSSRIYVLHKHNIPVTELTLAATALLLAGLAGRRFIHARGKK
jgi:hypothetical protein